MGHPIGSLRDELRAGPANCGDAVEELQSEASKVLARNKFTQKQLLAYTANMQTSLIGLEAGSGAHFLGRAPRKQGHDVRLIPAQFVKPS
jgi:transposase